MQGAQSGLASLTPMRLGIKGKLMAAVSLIMLAALSILGFRTYAESRKVLEQALVGQLKTEIEYWKHRTVEHRLADLKEAATFLASLPEAEKILAMTPGTSPSARVWQQFEKMAWGNLASDPAIVRIVLARGDGRGAWQLEREGQEGVLVWSFREEWSKCRCFREALSEDFGPRVVASIHLASDWQTGKVRAFLCVAAPVIRGAKRYGAVILDADFAAILHALPPPLRQGTLYLVDQEGKVFYRGKPQGASGTITPVAVDFKDVEPGLAPLITRKEEYFRFAGVERLHGFFRVYLNHPFKNDYFAVAYSLPYKVLAGSLDRITNIFILTGVVVFLVSLFAAGILARAVAKPVTQLAAVADRVAVGDLEVEVEEVARRDEIGRLYRSFRAMISALREAKSREEEKKVQILAAAGEAAVDVSRNLSVPVVLEKLVQAVVKVVNAECACLHLIEGEEEARFFSAGENSCEGAVLKKAGERGLAAMVFEKGEIVRLTEADIASVPYQPLRSEIRAFFGVPIFANDRVIGALCIGSAKGRITEADEAALKLLAAHAGVALSNARLHQEVVALAADLERRVAERTQELEAMNRELERANRLKSEFLAMMSHELRAPLNTIIGFTDVLLSDSFPDMPEKAKEYLRDIMESGEHLLALINDILDLAKIEAGKEKLYLEEIPVADFIRSTVALFREKAAKHGIQVEVSAEGVAEWVLDGRKFRQILFNLLSNAFKFTPDGGKVGVEAKIEDNILAVSVWDTGIGIAAEDLPRLFKPFEQLDSSLSRQYPGTGLGLAMVKKLVELHGGTVKVESEPGKGTRFTVYLPLLSYAYEDFNASETLH